jgi:hypothetical protein
MQYKGVVSNISSKDWSNKTLWSFQLNGQRDFFRTGDKKPPVERGQYITFEAIAGKTGGLNVDVNSIQVKEAEKEASGIVLQEPAKDTYWADKDARIEKQACRNTALQFIQILLAQEALKVPAKNKLEFFEELLSHYQSKFIADNSGTKEPAEGSSADSLPSSNPADYN